MPAEAVATVSHLRASPVKGLNQTERTRLTLVPEGIEEDRRFVIVDAGKALYGANLPELAGSTADWDAATGTLAIHFGDGETVTGAVSTRDATVALAYGGRKVRGAFVDGPWAEAISARARKPLTLIQTPVGVGAPGPITIIGGASIDRIAEQLAIAPEALGHRRFKMSVEVAGTDAYTEDGWSGRDLRIGEAVVRVGGQVPRCVLMTRDPDTARRDYDVLRAILAHRTPMAGGEPPLGVYATVVEPGVIRPGDPVEPV
jgi:uncharacterized protein YcbX